MCKLVMVAEVFYKHEGGWFVIRSCDLFDLVIVWLDCNDFIGWFCHRMWDESFVAVLSEGMDITLAFLLHCAFHLLWT